MIVSSSILNAQVMEPDSLIINQTWNDKNGHNELYIRVYAACSPDDLDKPPMGHESKIQVKLKNKKHDLAIHYELEFEQYQMQMLLFYEDDIRYFKIKGAQAVFIPFFYCGNYDSINRVSYIILYNNKAYLKHIVFYCSENGKCRLWDDLPNLSDMSKVLKKKLISEVEKYNDIKDFHDDWGW